MLRQNEIEEIIMLINNGVDLKLLSFELDIPIEQIQRYKEQLELRKSVKEAIKSGKAHIAIEKLDSFIRNTENNLVERLMLLKLNAYVDRTNIKEEELQKIEEEKQRTGFSKNIDEILDELKVQIPKRKSSNIKKKEKQNINEKHSKEVIKPDYQTTIQRYKEEIMKNSQNALNKRNLLAFAYFKAGRIDEARNELISLIEQCGSYTAYRQLIHLEKNEGNLDDAKLWAYDCIEEYPDSINIREQLISIAREEQDNQEIIKQLKEIININPKNKKNLRRLKEINNVEER